MNRCDYANPLGNQVKSLPYLVDVQLDHCFDQEVLHELFTVAEIFDIRHIYISGCGDSIAAAGAMEGVLERFTGTFGCKAVNSMEFARFTTLGDIGIGEPNSPLVIGISAGGGTARVIEILEKANQAGWVSLALTNKMPSRVSKTARKTFYLATPAMENDFPGLRSYFASMVGLIALACRIGHVRGALHPTAPNEFKAAISHYVHGFGDVMDAIDQQMFELAKSWKDLTRYNFIGSGRQLHSALFALGKFYECNGLVGNYDDDENWCHIDYHLKNPETIGTVLFADKHSPYFHRSKETVAAACGINRPTLVITNGNKGEFSEGAVVCKIPDTPEGFEWLGPLMEWAPAALLAGYCAALAGRKFFNEFNLKSGEWDGGGVFLNKDIMTTSSSKIEIFL